ncbi:hypothetical protein Tco_1179265 [Tanacetum coccineum]
MNTTQAQQKALDDALVAPADHLEFRKCNMRLKTDIKPKEATFQVVLDALALTPFYRAFLITVDVPAINMKEFWATVSVHKSSIRFTINKKKVSLDVDMFREILQVCPKILGQKFEDLPLEHDILSFIRNLGHSRDIIYLTDVNVDYLHQPWRAFATVINKCLSGKKTGMDKIPKQLKLATKRSKTQFHSSHASGLDEGTGTRPGVPDVPIYEFKSEKESWGDSEDKDEDNENDSDDLSDEGDDDNDGNNGNDDDANDDDKQEGDDMNDDDEETDSDRTKSDRIKIPIFDQSTTEYYEEEENIDDEEMMYDDEDDEVTKELYEDVNLLNLENPSPTDNEIASLMETSARHATTVPEITYGCTTTIHPPPSFFNPLLQHATPAPTPTTSKATTSFTSLLDFASVFKFNERAPAWKKIFDRYTDKKLGEAINKAIQAHNFDCREEAQAEKMEYIKLIDSTVRTIIKEEVNTQLTMILPQAISDVTTPVIKKNATESLEAAVTILEDNYQRERSQKSMLNYLRFFPSVIILVMRQLFAVFELKRFLKDNVDRGTSPYGHSSGDHKNGNFMNALVKSYQIDKDLFDSYGEVFSLKRSRDDRDKDRDPSAGSYRGMKRRK